MSRESQKTISLFGSGHATPGDGVFEFAVAAGRVLAEAGFVVANGGYGGTMLASAQGAVAAGGHVVGVTCSAFGRAGPNAFVTDERKTDTLEQRLATLLNLGDAYVVFPGGTGTLLELATVWELANKGLADREKPIVLAGAFWRPLLDLMALQDSACVGLLKQVDRAESLPGLLGSIL